MPEIKTDTLFTKYARKATADMVGAKCIECGEPRTREAFQLCVGCLKRWTQRMLADDEYVGPPRKLLKVESMEQSKTLMYERVHYYMAYKKRMGITEDPDRAPEIICKEVER